MYISITIRRYILFSSSTEKVSIRCYKYTIYVIVHKILVNYHVPYVDLSDQCFNLRDHALLSIVNLLNMIYKGGQIGKLGIDE